MRNSWVGNRPDTMANRLGLFAGVVPLAWALAWAMTGFPAAGSADRAVASADSGAGPAAYTGDLTFDILRDGDKVGAHTVIFERKGNRTVARAETDIAIRVLFFTAFRFTYESESEWEGDRMMSLRARTDDDGDVTFAEARREGDLLKVRGSRGEYTVEGGIFPTDHWHAGVIGATQVLNTVTGGLNEVSMQEKGRERLDLPGGAVTARRFAYSGQLETEVWYDEKDRWIRMRFGARDGSVIEYVCRSCRAGSSLSRKK